MHFQLETSQTNYFCLFGGLEDYFGRAALEHLPFQSLLRKLTTGKIYWKRKSKSIDKTASSNAYSLHSIIFSRLLAASISHYNITVPLSS